MHTSLERVALALDHKEPDMVPLDLGATGASGMVVNSVYLLRQALRLDPPGTPVKVIDPYHMLGEIAQDLLDALGVDVVGLTLPVTRYGYRNEGWKPWTAFDGTPTLVPAGFNTEREPNGDLLMYPEGDRSAPPSARMPSGGLYFDAIERQEPIDEETLTVDDNLEEVGPITDQDLGFLRDETERLAATGRAIVGSFGGTSLGDITRVCGMGLKHPRGIRGVAEWYMSLSARRDFVYELFDRQTEIALRNLARIYQVVGDRVSVAFVTGTDFGAQSGPLVSPKMYRELFKPFHTRLNGWIHQQTGWKTFIHSCGSVWRLLDDIVEAGFDIVNPIQTSAADMDPAAVKARYGQRVTLWGGGIDTQRVLPFGTPEEVRAMVRERMRVFGPGGGFVFTTIHNVQAGIPTENLLALYDAVRRSRAYPLQ